jgi:hypothetical protein
VSSESPALDDAGRYRVDARTLPFTPSWFWEVIDTAENAIVENSLALSRTVYESPTEALTAGHEYVVHGFTRRPRRLAEEADGVVMPEAA